MTRNLHAMHLIVVFFFVFVFVVFVFVVVVVVVAAAAAVVVVVVVIVVVVVLVILICYSIRTIHQSRRIFTWYLLVVKMLSTPSWMAWDKIFSERV